MLKYPLYLLYGLLTVGGIGYQQYRGMGYGSVSETKRVPKSIRDNPGAYRSHYGYVPRYTGGK